MEIFNSIRRIGARSVGSTLAGFFLFLALFHANGRALPEVDCVAAPYMAWSMVRNGSWDLREYPELRRLLHASVREKPDGGWYSIRPPGSAIVAIPFVAPFALTQARPLSEENMYRVGKFAAAACVAAAAMFLLRGLQSLAPEGAWPATILFAFGTCAYSTASQALWMHGPAVLWLCAAFYYLTRTDNRVPASDIVAGFALGMAVLTRPATAFFAVATVGATAVQHRWRAVGALALGGTIPASILLDYNIVYFNNPLLGGYADDNWAVSPPLWLGLGGLLIAPSRGVFVYSPALLLALPGVRALIAATERPLLAARTLLLAWLAAAVATLVFYARWYDWPGGWSFGPRLLCETMPIACTFFALGYTRLARGWQRQAAVALILVSVGVQILGVFGRDAFAPWQSRHTLGDQGRSLFSFSDTQIEAHARALASRIEHRASALTGRVRASCPMTWCKI